MTDKKDNRGSVSKNKRKDKETHPDIKGSAVIDGVAYWISGWQKQGDDGPWYSLAFDRKEERAPSRETGHRTEPAAPEPGFEDDIPF